MRDTSTRTPAKVGGPSTFVRLFGSVWFGIVLLTLTLIYSAIFSAVAPVRWALEMTEMQAFSHWLFVTLGVLFMLALGTTTLVRIRWSGVNIGSLTAHVGLFLLLGGAMVYFGTKVEGSVLIQSPRILVRGSIGSSTGLAGQIPAAVGQRWRSAPDFGPPQAIEVTNVVFDPATLRATQAAVRVTGPGGETRAVDLTLSGSWLPISDTLAIGLVSEPGKSSFYDNEIPALYFRTPDGRQEIIKIVHELPIYRERYLPGEGDVRDAQGNVVASKRYRPAVRLFGATIPTGWFERWDMPIEVDSEGLPFDVRITGYLPYVTSVRGEEAADGTMRTIPIVAPRSQRQDVSARAMSAIRLQFTGRGADANWNQSQWCMFSVYPDVDTNALPIRLPGSNQTWELIYSRQRHDLNATIAARKLYVTHYPGERGVESFHSQIMLRRNDGSQPVPTIVETNQTAAAGTWTLYQSGFASDNWTYSILGVGNRNGMLPMNVGWVMVTLGCLYAFYIKPVLMRRARRRSAQRRDALSASAAVPAEAEVESREPVGV